MSGEQFSLLVNELQELGDEQAFERNHQSSVGCGLQGLLGQPVQDGQRCRPVSLQSWKRGRPETCLPSLKKDSWDRRNIYCPAIS